MKDYIIKKYEADKKIEKNKNGKKPLISNKDDVIVFIIFALMIIGYLEMIITLTILPNTLYSFIGLGLCFILFVILYVLFNRDQKKQIDKYIKNYNEELNKLEKFLDDNFKIKSREKIIELIAQYKEYIDTKKKKEKIVYNIMVSVITSAMGLVSVFLNSTDTYKIDLRSFISFVLSIIIIAAMLGLVMYLFKSYDKKTISYKKMLGRLEDLLLIKY